MGPTGAALTGSCGAPSEDGPRPWSWSPPSTQASRARPGTPLAGSPGAGGPAGRWREGGVEGAWDKWVPERGALVTQARAALPAWEVPVSTPAVDLQLPGPEEADQPRRLEKACGFLLVFRRDRQSGDAGVLPLSLGCSALGRAVRKERLPPGRSERALPRAAPPRSLARGGVPGPPPRGLRFCGA